MRLFGYSVMCSLCALIMGVLLVMWPEAAMIYLVITVGVLFLLPGLYGIFAYFASRSREEDGSGRAFPIVALGSALLGIWLIVMPAFFVGILMYVLGALLVLGGIGQLMNFISIRKLTGSVPAIFYVIPGLALAGGHPDFSKPIRSRKNPLHRIRRIFYRLWFDRPLPHHPLPEEEQSGDNGCGSDRGVRISDFCIKKMQNPLKTARK